MTTTRRTTARHLMWLLAAALTAGCASTPVPAAPADTSTPAQLATEAYERYWEVTESAFAAPGARDWTSELQSVASGQALESATADYRTYRDYPAHSEGTVSRSPVVGSATEDRVEIVDCLDLGDSLLVADETGDILDDLDNRVQRYTLRVDLARSATGWKVDRLRPALDEPC